MAPPRKDVHDNAPIARIRRTAISGLENLEPSCIRQHFDSLLVILAKYFHIETDEQMKSTLFGIGIEMLPVMMNTPNREHFTLFEFFVLNLDGFEAHRAEIMAAMMDKVTELQLAKKWCNMRVPCEELRKRTKLLGEKIQNVLGIRNLLDNVPYSVGLFSITLYSTIVTENSNLYRASYVAQFRNPEDVSFDIIQTEDFEQYLQFLMLVFQIVCRIKHQIRERIQNEGEALVSLQRLSPDQLQRRANMNMLVDRLHRRVEEVAKKEEDQVVPPPAPAQLPQNNKPSSPGPFQLLCRYVNIRIEDVGTEFYSIVNRQTGIETDEIEKFFEHLHVAREVMAWDFEEKSADEYSRLYG